jgi:hypothetical protein
MMMSNTYTMDFKVRIHMHTNNVDKAVGDVIEQLLAGCNDHNLSPEIQLMNTKEGIWYLFPVGDSTDEWVLDDLSNPLYVWTTIKANAGSEVE